MHIFSGSSEEDEDTTLSEYEKTREKRIKQRKKVLAEIMKVGNLLALIFSILAIFQGWTT